ncbi:gex interacting protein 4, variant [Loa loa]|uniref:Gex interacting protein 4 n=1 Tax=Loa loa TaxID=7209 RepID=A0A1S0UE97_LOALO|nr:gex interacting protein 4 [Loa loa]XP_020304933.1 gex interacting protein 4, variant [Loa loa]EFO27523.1 gex interacting protein 4 [Loa loa]EJD73990.1 gex interacting protein 4, variant [Loa loa]
MNQNLVPAYFQTGNISNSAPQQVEHVVIGDRVSILKDETKSTMQLQASAPTGMTIHSAGTFFQTTSSSPFTTANSGPVFHSSTTAATFLPNSVQNVQIQPNTAATLNGQQTQQVRLVQAVNPTPTVNVTSPQQQGATVLTVVTAQNPNGTTMQILQPQGAETDERRIAAILDSYFIEQQAPTTSVVAPITTAAVAVATPAAYPSPASIVAKYTRGKGTTQEKKEKDEAKRAKQAEAARLRYHRLSAEEKRALNIKRTMAQKRKRQREKELEELENLLRQTNDIQEDPDINEQLREKRMRARWAEAARSRYQRMSSEERRAHNNRRRMRQIAATEGLKGPDGQPDEEAIKRHIKEQNAKKAEAARLRYHRMTEEEKRAYNQRRTEAFRRRRMEEEMLLAMPIGRINGEALDRAQQIVVRNAKRAEAARLRYQRMTPEQRKAYNQKRYIPKRKRLENSEDAESNVNRGRKRNQEEQFDALSTLERDVIKRTQQAQQALMRQRGTSSANTPTGAYLTAHVVQQPQSNVTTVLPSTAIIPNSSGVLPGGTMLAAQIQPSQIQTAPIQAQQVQSQQANRPLQQSMAQIPQQVQVQQIHPQQIQNQSSQQQPQQQIQYTVTPGGQMMVGQHLQQQLLTPYATVPPRA